MTVKYQAIAAFAALALVGTFTTVNATTHRTQDSVSESANPTLENNSGHVLGSLVDASTIIPGPGSPNYTTAEFYSSSLHLLVPIGPTGDPGISFGEEFTSTNCTGTGYFVISNPLQDANPSSYLTLLANYVGGYFKLQHTPPVSIPMYSTMDPGNSCDAVNPVDQLAVPVTPIISLPFTTPIALPLRLAG